MAVNFSNGIRAVANLAGPLADRFDGLIEIRRVSLLVVYHMKSRGKEQFAQGHVLQRGVSLFRGDTFKHGGRNI